MPYAVVLKDERRTSNAQHRMKKQTSNTEHSTCREPLGLERLGLSSSTSLWAERSPGRATTISVSFQPFDSAQGREPVERPF